MKQDEESLALSLERSALVATREDLGCLFVRGRDARSWLQGIVTCDVADVGPERAVPGLLLDQRGKIQSELFLVQGDEGLALLCPKAGLSAVLDALAELLIMEDVELSDDSRRYGVLMLLGARAGELGRTEKRGDDVFAGTLTWGRAPAALWVVPSDRVAECVGRLAQSEPAVRALSEADWNALRVSLGVPLFGVDYTNRDSPHQAGLDRRAVSWTKGCYLGQEAVCMQDMRGKLKRRLVLLRIEGPLPSPGDPVKIAGIDQALGPVTSAADFGGCAWAFASLGSEGFEGGRTLEVGGARAEVVADS